MRKLLVHSSLFMVHGKKIVTLILALFFTLKTYYLILTTILPSSAYAQTGIGLNPGKQPGGIKLLDPKNPDTQLGNVFTNILTLLFTVGALGFIIMFVWGAVDWILSGGDKEKIAGARKRIVTAITGLVLLALTFVITIIVGQVLGLCSLRHFIFPIPQLINLNNELCKPPQR